MEGNLQADGIILLIICLIGGIFMLTMQKKAGVMSIIVGIMIILMTFFEMSVNRDNMREIEYSSLISQGIGFYALLFGGFAIIISGVLRNTVKGQ